jgi:O-antigen/teichoic acid export membrane protein
MARKRSGGSAAILGAKALRYSGIQGGLLAAANALMLGGVLVVAFFLGPADFGRYGLLLFLAALLNILFNLASKQGTLKRVFGTAGDDDEDEEDEDGDETAAATREDKRSLGTGMVVTAIVSMLGTAAVIALREPIADLLLGSSGYSELIVWAAIAGGAGAVFRLASLVLWLERRPGAHVAAEVARPVLMLAGVLLFVIPGAGLEGAIAGTALGIAAAAALALVLLRGSYQWAFSLAETKRIYALGAPRIPIVLSMWTVMNADIFILSRFVSAADLGVYQLASRVGILVALLPGGFRMAMRPLRKTVAYKSVQQEYGRAVARGQELGYFVLLCVSTLLVVVLAAEVLVRAAPSGYADAAPLIPLLAAGLMGPSVMRQISRSVSIPRKRLNFILSVVAAALIFIASCVVLIPELGLEAAPLSMLIAFGLTGAYLLGRGQRGDKPIRLPYLTILGSAALATFAGLVYHLIDPAGAVIQIGLAVALYGAYLAAIVVTGIVPRRHRGALYRVARGFIGEPASGFRPQRALRRLDPPDREALRLAIREGRPVAEIPGQLEAIGLSLPEASAGAGQGAGDGAAISERLVAAVRRAAAKGGAPVPIPKRADGPGRHDARIAEFLFPEGTVAQRDARMRGLLSGGVRGKELVALEAVVEGLARAPERAWQGDERP